jgi:hypothetical protein
MMPCWKITGLSRCSMSRFHRLSLRNVNASSRETFCGLGGACRKEGYCRLHGNTSRRQNRTRLRQDQT